MSGQGAVVQMAPGGGAGNIGFYGPRAGGDIYTSGQGNQGFVGFPPVQAGGGISRPPKQPNNNPQGGQAQGGQVGGK